MTTPAPQDFDPVAFVQGFRGQYRDMVPHVVVAEAVDESREISIPATTPTRVIRTRLYVPGAGQDSSQRPLVIYVHGGGFIAGDFDTHDALVRALANRTQALVLAVDYRLAPEHPFPAGLDDVMAVLAWAAANALQLGADARAMAIAGDSAGGTLAAAAAIRARDQGGPRIAAEVLFYPMTDCAMDSASWARLGDTHFPTRQIAGIVNDMYVPEGLPKQLSPLVSPLRAELHGLPPTLTVTAGLDPLSDEGCAYAEKLKSAGVPVESKHFDDAVHGFVQFFHDNVNHPHGARALDEAAAFLRRIFAK